MNKFKHTTKKIPNNKNKKTNDPSAPQKNMEHTMVEQRQDKCCITFKVVKNRRLMPVIGP